MTREQAAKWVPIIEAYAAGKTVEWLYAGMWVTKTPHYIFDEEPENYRIQPEPQLREWVDGELPVNAIYRAKLNGDIYYPSSQDKHSVSFCGCASPFVFTYDLKQLFEEFEYSPDGGKTFLPCGVLE